MSHLTAWQALALLASLAATIVVGKLVGRWTHRALTRLCLASRIALEERLVARLAGPIAALCAVGTWLAAIHCYDLPGDVLVFARRLGSIGLLVALCWIGLRAIDSAVEAAAARSSWISGHRLSQSVMPLARRIAKVALLAIAGIMILSEAGYSVGPLIAGLGITGIAVALAAQKTLEHVFGAFAIGVDHPFREGDAIKLDNGLAGTVEAIGLRSTRIRTADRTLVSVPNGKLADSQIETLAARDRMRLHATLRLELSTTRAQLARVLRELDGELRAQPERGPEPPEVHLAAIGDAWFELELTAWFQCASWAELEALRDRVLLRCLDLIAAAGVTLHGAPAPAPQLAPRMRTGGRS